MGTRTGLGERNRLVSSIRRTPPQKFRLASWGPLKAPRASALLRTALPSCLPSCLASAQVLSPLDGYLPQERKMRRESIWSRPPGGPRLGILLGLHLLGVGGKRVGRCRARERERVERMKERRKRVNREREHPRKAPGVSSGRPVFKEGPLVGASPLL